LWVIDAELARSALSRGETAMFRRGSGAAFGGTLSALVVGVPLAFFSAVAYSALIVTSGSQLVTEDFDSLASTGSPTPAVPIPWTNDSTLPGWSLFSRRPSPVSTALTEYRAGSGTNNTGSFYSFGTSTTSTERALGGVGSQGDYWGSPSAGTVAGWIAAAFVNSSGNVLDGFSVAFDGEQWRNGGNTSAQTMVFEYGFGATFDSVAAWTAGGTAFDFTSPIHTATTAALNGNAAANRVAGLGGTIDTTWAAGDTLWLRWVERNDAGNDHGLAIDNFSLTAGRAIPEPGTLALLGLGLAGLAATRRRKQ